MPRSVGQHDVLQGFYLPGKSLGNLAMLSVRNEDFRPAIDEPEPEGVLPEQREERHDDRAELVRRDVRYRQRGRLGEQDGDPVAPFDAEAR